MFNIFFPRLKYMENIFTISKHSDQYDDDVAASINIDDLYEKKRERDMVQLNIFNKILRRIHSKIQLTSRQKKSEKLCWFVVPEIMLGVPAYEQSGCIAYVMDRLKSDGFGVKYVHPNTLFMSWGHWVPNYVISEIKSKTGIEYDNYGNKVISEAEAAAAAAASTHDPYSTAPPTNTINGPMVMSYSSSSSSTMPKTSVVLNPKQGVFQKKRDTTVYRPIDNYKPQGSMVYDKHLLFDMAKKR